MGAAALSTIHVLRGLGPAVGLLFICGYPYLVILGLPDGVVRIRVKSWARFLFIGFLGLLILLAVLAPFFPEGYATPLAPQTVREWLELLLGVAVDVVVFGPFFLGSAALNDSRRAMKQDPTLESFTNFIALYFGIFGGLIYVHGRVRECCLTGVGADAP